MDRTTRRIRKNGTVFLLTASLVVSACASQPGVRTLQTSRGATIGVHIAKAENPKAILVLFEGGPGLAHPGSGNGFMNANFDRFVEKGLTVVMMDAPSDERNWEGGMQPGFRWSKRHVSDIDLVARMLHREADLPIWMAGISAGANSVANYAINRPGSIGGAILLASGTNPRRGTSVAESGLDAVTAPLLAISHAKDACPLTPPEGARQIAGAAANSREAVARFLDGGWDAGGNPCRPRTYHTFNGVEDRVVSMIADFIGKHTK